MSCHPSLGTFIFTCPPHGQMSSDGIVRVTDAFLGGIVGEVIGSARRATGNSAWARALREYAGADPTGEQMKDTLARAFADAADGSGAPRALVKRFAEHKENRKAIADLIADPHAAFVVRKSMAIGPQERKQLDLLADNLRDAVRSAVDHQLSPEGRRILGEIESAQEAITGEVRSGTDQTLARLERLEAMFSDHMGAQVTVPATESEDEPDAEQGSRLALAEAAKREGRHADAEREAKEIVASYSTVDFGNLDEDGRAELRQAHRILADIYIADPNAAALAKPHLETILRLWDGTPQGRFANRAILRLLSDDYEGALQSANEALVLEPDNEAARSVKANAFVHLGRASEATEMYDGDGAEEASMRAWLLRMGHDYPASRRAASVVLDASDAPLGPRVQAAQVFAETTLLEFAPLFEYGAKPRRSDVHDVLLEAIGHLDWLLSVVGDQRPVVRADALLYRASLYEWTGQPGARADMEEAVRLQPDNDRAIRNLVVLLSSAEEHDKSMPLAEQLLDLDSSPESNRLAISVALQAGDLHGAAARLEPLAADPATDPDATEAALILADAYGSAMRTGDAEQVLDAVEAGGHAPLGLALARVRQAARMGQDTVPILEAAAALDTPDGIGEHGRRELGRWRLVRLQLGDGLLSAGDSARAAELLAPFVDPDSPDPAAIRYAASLLNTGRSAECLDLCDRAVVALGAEGGLAVEFEAIAAAVHMNLDAFVDAAERYARILPGRHERTRDLVAWGTALIRLGQPARALDILRLAESRVADDPARLAVVGNAYAEAGNLPKALDLAYRALDLAFDEEPYHRNFAGLFLTHGDQISDAGPLDKKYLDRFHDILYHHAERFPSDTPFVRMEKIPEDPDEMLEKLIEMVRPLHKAHQAVRSRLLKGGSAPLHSIADLLGRNQVEAWEAVTSKGEWGRLAFPGHLRGRARSLDAGRSASVVSADPSALLTLHGLGLLRPTLRSFDEVLVPQGFIDELHHAVAVNDANPDGARMYMGLDETGTSLSITEASPEVARRHRDRVRDLYDILIHAATDPTERLCRIVGRPPTPPGPVAGDDPAAFADVLGDAGDAALVAEARGVVLLSDGFMVRRQAEAAGILTTDSYAALDRLVRDDVINAAQLEDARLQLIAWGYRYVSMTADTLLRSVVRERGLLTDRSRLALSYLVQEASEPVSATGVVAEFIARLWQTDVGGPLPATTVRRQWTALAFETLSHLMSPLWARSAIIDAARRHLRAYGTGTDVYVFADAVSDGFKAVSASPRRRRRAA